MKKNKVADNLMGYGFLTPAILVLGIFIFGSIFYAIYISFHRVNLFTGYFEFIGLDNYRRVFNDTATRRAFYNTTLFASVVVPTQTIIAMVLAAVLNSKIKGKMFFRTIYFLPTLTSSAALTMIFMFLFSLTGPVNQILMRINILDTPINFLNNPRFALQVIMAMNIWSTVPFFMTIYLAGLQEIPKSLYEAAEIDGANNVQKFLYITVPHLKPITTFVVLMGIIGTFQMFDQAYIFSNGSGGPENSTLTVALLIFRYAFGQNNTMGYAAALSIVLSIVIFTISFIAQKLNKSESLY
ncbi:carbohydrate ABC transporter permease [Anaerobranca gottschalkii]|uniref:Carbohydrate ABC transporter membrane protein 1, CUT1 family (TC 3.A.1.1.-) n=1 Tax=Anaerobranca gottschalkii DSM 13577 TaxID=1120990 RepID=A0A1H9YNX4_9FIRM|nr:sugar ABC transporter permease [Anaerobranca gottschalkii]SES70781.1 carbohydrate ABC transporter membrane protein 1, CUT1 family (TC 3.A.1.1.-) [Anaerobranca gottschalkii DSM 13577]